MSLRAVPEVLADGPLVGFRRPVVDPLPVGVGVEVLGLLPLRRGREAGHQQPEQARSHDSAPHGEVNSYTATDRGVVPSPTVQIDSVTRQPAASSVSNSFILGPRNGSATRT